MQGGGPATTALLGLGAMGSAMAVRLAAQGPLAVYDPDPERMQPAIAAGAAPAASAAEAARDAAVILVAVRDDRQVQDALFGADGALTAAAPGAIVVVTSTVGVAAIRATEQRAAERGAELVDAPVSGGPTRAGDGDLVVMLGCPADRLERVRPVLSVIASRLHQVGPEVGNGQALKIVNQLLAGVHIAAAAEALALAQGVGLDAESALDALTAGAGASFMLADRGPRMLTEVAEVRSELDIFVKDMGLVASLARESSVAVSLAAAAEQLYVLASNHGLGRLDDSALFGLLAHGQEAHA